MEWLSMKKCWQHMSLFKATSLTELLVALLILGQIAAFTIPKVLNAQRNNKLNAITKEAMATISEAYMLYKMNNQVNPTSFNFFALYPYINYVAEDTSTPIDSGFGGGTWGCSIGFRCVRLANGAIMNSYNSDRFG
jgi:type II secretory pathway pseudopilin PulG